LHVYGNLPNDLHVPFAEVAGAQETKKRWMEKFGEWHHRECVSNFKPNGEIRWAFTILKTGLYEVHIEYDCLPTADDAEFFLEAGTTGFAFPFHCTGNGHAKRARFRTECLGTVHFDKTGPGSLSLRVLSIGDGSGLALARVRLVPV